MATDDIRARIQRNARTPWAMEPPPNEDILSRIQREALEHSWKLAKEREQLAAARAVQERRGKSTDQ